MGNRLRKREPPDVAAMEKWVSLTSTLIRKYLGDESAGFFLVHDGDNSFDGRLHRLKQVADKPVDFAAKLQADFDLAEALELYPDDWGGR